jgi:lipopolysaccharide transport protein LptA
MKSFHAFPVQLGAGAAAGLLGLVALAGLPSARAQQAAPAKVQKPASVEPGQQRQQVGDTIVTADNIDYDLDKQVVVATGSVDLVTGTSHMTSEKMTVQMSGKRKLQWAKAEGKVYLEKKNPADNSTIIGTGAVGEYYDAEQKANLQGGDVVLRISSEKLAKPAVITGARADMDLANKVNVVVRKPNEQARVHVEPKGTEGKPEPEPLDLVGDKITQNSATQEYIANGDPVLVRPTSRLSGRTIRFKVDEQTQDVKVAYAEKDVVFDGQNQRGTLMHATGDDGVFTRDTHEIVLTGMVRATSKDPDDEKPTVYQGHKFIYNTQTRASRLLGGGATGERSKVVIPEGPKPAGDGTDSAAPKGDKPGGKSSGAEKGEKTGGKSPGADKGQK